MPFGMTAWPVQALESQLDNLRAPAVRCCLEKLSRNRLAAILSQKPSGFVNLMQFRDHRTAAAWRRAPAAIV